MEEREKGYTVLHAPISTKVVILCVVGETAEITFGFRRYPYWHARIIDFNLKPGLYCICTCEHFAMTSISSVTSQNRTLFSTNKHLFPKNYYVAVKQTHANHVPLSLKQLCILHLCLQQKLTFDPELLPKTLREEMFQPKFLNQMIEDSIDYLLCDCNGTSLKDLSSLTLTD
jgi:hypothetical protein